MRSALVILLVTAAAVGQDSREDARALVEIFAPRASYFVNEAVRVTTRVVYDATFFKEKAIRTTRQEIDLPMLLSVPFLHDPPDATLLPQAPPTANAAHRRQTIAVNDGRADVRPAADRIVLGRPWSVVELDRRIVFHRAGVHVIGGPTLRYTYATSFEEDLVGGRVPVDRKDGFAAGPDLALTIAPLPDEGRPPGFSGAVGRFTIDADADRRDIALGESIKLRVTIAGDGDLASFAAPRPALAGFKVLGVLERTEPLARILTYDIAPTSDDVSQVPPIAFSSFEPDPRPRYTTARTRPIPITVRPRAATSTASRPEEPRAAESRPPRLVAGENDAYDVTSTGIPRGEAAFHAGRFKEAIAIFEAARLCDAARPAVIDFAIGTSLYRMGRPAEAIVAYRRALRAAPRDAKTRFNLRFAERELGVAESPRGLLDTFTAKEVAAIGGVLAVLGMVMLIRSRGHLTPRVVAGLLLLAAVVAGAYAIHQTWISVDGEAVVVANEIAVRVDPHAEVAVIARLRAGETVAVRERTDRWVRLAHATGSGWTERAGVALIVEER